MNRSTGYCHSVPDAIADLARLPEVAPRLADARAAVDDLLWNRSARERGRSLVAESTLLGAWADAAFEGAEIPRDSLRSGVVEDSPMGRTAARTLAMYAQIPAAAETLRKAPLQALAALHAAVAVGSDGGVGRPRSGAEPADPLTLRTAVPAAEAAQRMAALADVLTGVSAAPALAVAAVVHAEIAVTQPFDWGSGLVARAMTRVVLRSHGVDPDGWSIPEAGLRMMGRPKYVRALREYASGDVAGVSGWLATHADMVAAGARAAADLVADLPPDE